LKSLRDALSWLAVRIDEDLGLHVWFADIFGHRWSYVAGKMSSEPSEMKTSRVPLDSSTGMVVEGWEALPVTQGRKLLGMLKSIAATGRKEQNARQSDTTEVH
jgi:hypothetical protein